MTLLFMVLTLILPLAISIYTFNFAIWLYRRRQVRGAIGVFVVAVLCTAYPAWLILRGF